MYDIPPLQYLSKTFKPIFHCDAKFWRRGLAAIAPTPDFCVGDTNMLVSFALGGANFSRFYPTGNLKVAFYPTRNPNASQWNIGRVGCQRQIFSRRACTFHVFCVDFICVGHPTQTRF